MKRKFNVLINIATLCLCVCAIAIGVYSAKSASLNVGGSVGFVAHNCEIELNGSIVACVDSNATKTKEVIIPQTFIGRGDVPSAYSLNLNKTFSGSESGKMYFSDMFEGGKIITITLKVKNQSKYDVVANVSRPTFENSACTMSVTLDGTDLAEAGTSIELTKDGATESVMVITITLNDDTNDIAGTSISGNLFEFAKGNKEDELAGTWVFNATIIGAIDCDVNFVCLNKSFTGIRYTNSTLSDLAFVYDDNGNFESGYLNGWRNVGYKGITITSKLSEVTNGEELLAWLNTNAKKTYEKIVPTYLNFLSNTELFVARGDNYEGELSEEQYALFDEMSNDEGWMEIEDTAIDYLFIELIDESGGPIDIDFTFSDIVKDILPEYSSVTAYQYINNTLVLIECVDNGGETFTLRDVQTAPLIICLE